MAGSRKSIRYFTDAGDVYALDADESNVEGIHKTPPDVTAANENDTPYTLPRNVRPRKAVYKSTTTVHTRVIPVSTNSQAADLISKEFALMNQTFTENVAGTELTFKFAYMRPERVKAVSAIDTGLNEGDDS